MSNLSGVFNNQFAQEAQGGDYTPVPEGVYRVMIVEDEMKQTKNGTGQYLELKMSIVEGEHKNKTFYERLNLINNSEQARNIAHRNFGSICEQLGIDPNKVQDSSELKAGTFLVALAIEGYNDAEGKPRSRNVVKSYAPKEQPAPQQATTAQPAQQQHVQQQPAQAQAQPAPQGSNPW